METTTSEISPPHRRRPDVSSNPDIDFQNSYKTMETCAVVVESGSTNEDGLLKGESHMRSLLKGLTWRILATTTTTIIAWAVTGKVDAALQIGFFEFFAKLTIYYIHERIWTRIHI